MRGAARRSDRRSPVTTTWRTSKPFTTRTKARWTMWLTDVDGNALALDEAPMLNLVTPTGSVRVKGVADEGRLALHPRGALRPTRRAPASGSPLQGKVYTPELPVHDHGDADHEGHDHEHEDHAAHGPHDGLSPPSRQPTAPADRLRSS